MSEVAQDYVISASTLVMRVRELVTEALAIQCDGGTVMNMRDWCQNLRGCHSTCTLLETYERTGDARFAERAQVCGGRCMGWDYVGASQGQGACSEGAEEWQGHLWKRSDEIDFNTLGLHPAGCPLKGFRNKGSAHLRVACGQRFLEPWHRKLCAVEEALRSIEGLAWTGKRLFQAALVAEAARKSIRGALAMASCGARHRSDPWTLGSALAWTCGAKRPPTVKHLLREASRCVQEVVGNVCTAVVLVGILSSKPSPIVSLSAAPPERRRTSGGVRAAPSESQEAPPDSQDLPVTQPVSHSDPAAHVSAAEAEQIVRAQEAGFIERMLDAEPWNDQEEADRDRIVLGNINRFTKDLAELLREGVSLKPCREALEAAGYPFRTPEGAMLAVHPHQHPGVRRALADIDLKPSNLVFAESLEHLLEEAFSRCRSKGAWMRERLPLDVELDGSQASRAGSHQEPEGDQEDAAPSFTRIRTIRTFVHADIVGTDQETAHVTASTTDCHMENPRLAGRG